jgi:tetratricopeptide (TPR) repeat protein
MNAGGALAAAAVAIATLTLPSPSRAQDQDWPEIVRRHKDAVVLVETIYRSLDSSAIRVTKRGTGFVISPQGHVVTAAHVVPAIPEYPRREWNVYQRGRPNPFSAKLLGVVLHDLPNGRNKDGFALLQAETLEAPKLIFAASVDFREGDPVMFMGFPYEKWDWKAGHVTNIHHGNFWLAKLQSGDGASGAPILDKCGRVLGIVVGAPSGLRKDETLMLPQAASGGLLTEFAKPASGPCREAQEAARKVTECDILAASPDHPKLPIGLRGVPFDELQNADKAVVACLEDSNARPHLPRVWFQLGRAYLKKALDKTGAKDGDFPVPASGGDRQSLDAAEKALDEAIRLDGDRGTYAAAYAVRGEVRLVSQATRLVSQHPQRAIWAWLAAIADFTRAIDLGLEAAHLYDRRGYAYWQSFFAGVGLVSLDKAIGDFAEAIKRDRKFARRPYVAEAYRLHAGRYSTRFDYDRAIDELRHIIALAPDDAGLNQALGHAYLGKEDWKEAIDPCNKGGDYECLAEAYVQLGERGKAIAELSRFLESPDTYSKHNAYIARGNAYFHLHQFDEALADYNAAIKHWGSADAYFHRGIVHERQDRQRAIDDYREALKRDWTHLGARNALRFLGALAVSTPFAPLHAIEIEKGQCQRALSRRARVLITDDTGVRSEVDPTDHKNIRAELRTLPDGRKSARKWLRGWLPLEDGAGGQLIYRGRKEGNISELPLASEWSRQTIVRQIREGQTGFAAKVGAAVERVDKAALGECQATFVTIAITFSGDRGVNAHRIWLLFVRELGFFVAEAREEEHGGPRILFRANRIELLR